MTPPDGSQFDARDLDGSTPLHPADAFTGDKRPVFSAYMRHLPASVARVASFAVPIGGRIEDKRAARETTVPGCEGASCAVRTDG